MNKINSNLSVSKTRRWRRTLDSLLEENGRDLKWLCSYINAAYNEGYVSFYEKLPRKRETYIGIGMAFRQSLDVINTWIIDLAGKKKLYAKDISGDLVWIYLIQRNLEDDDPEANYFLRYEECQDIAFAAYNEVWSEVTSRSQETVKVQVLLDKAAHEQDLKGLTHFIRTNIDSFKTAYSRPRQYLSSYVNAVFRTDLGEPGKYSKLNRMRGYLDDSMINYLSGDDETINTYDWKNRRKTLNIKYVPKTRRFHISLALALGMNAGEIDHYLDLMGYAPLDPDEQTEGLLLRLLSQWDSTHPFQRVFKERLLSDDAGQDRPALSDTGTLTAEYTAFQEELLFMREELSERFREQGVPFPYMNK